jgi:hypothetical protein
MELHGARMLARRAAAAAPDLSLSARGSSGLCLAPNEFSRDGAVLAG